MRVFGRVVSLRDDDVCWAAADSTRDMTMSPFAGMGTGSSGQPQDYGKLFKAERDNLEFAEGLYAWGGQEMDSKILCKYGKVGPSRG